MNEIERIDDQIQKAYAGEAWHGPALREILAGVTAQQAASRPLPNAHSIWEIVNHVSVWTLAVVHRLKGEQVAVPAEGDWPTASDTSDAAWIDTLAVLENNYRALRKEIAGLDEARLEAPCGGRSDSCYVHLHGTIQHYLYHAGQIALLKKA